MAFLCATPCVLNADVREDEPRAWRDGWSITAFIGQHDDSRFGEIVSMRGWRLEPTYIAGAALNRKFGEWFDGMLHWEVEGSLFRYWGEQRHWEGNAALVARWTYFPWDDYVDTSFAFGQGVSMASRRPAVERDDTRKFLNHLLTEFEFAPPRDSPWSVVARLHHRSGVFGLYGTRGGSNFVTLGLRYRFQ